MIYNGPSGRGDPASLWLAHQTSVFEHLLLLGGGQLKAGRRDWGRPGLTGSAWGHVRRGGGCLPAPPWVRAVHEGSLGYLPPRELASG